MCGIAQMNLHSSQCVKEIGLLITAKNIVNVLHYMGTSYRQMPLKRMG